MNFVEQISHASKEICVVDTLTEKDMWEEHGSVIWQANEFIGSPSFYPVYKWNNYYSFSVLALIIHKGYISPNLLVENLNNPLHIIPNNRTVDNDIIRVGGPHEFECNITDTLEYCVKVSEALITDTKKLESTHEGFTNIVMCGGKDSLNLLLLPWENPVIALSAEPNYSYVCEFVKVNNLNVDVMLLEDKYDEALLENEILEACCRVDLSHWRWGIHLREIVAKLNFKVIIWKGQLGDVYLSETWKTYDYPIAKSRLLILKIYKRVSPLLPFFINKAIGKNLQANVIKTTWEKSANQQGSHVGFIRSLCNCLVLSAYHGENVSNVFSQVHLGAAVQKDVRAKIGELLLGKAVIYPTKNPGPAVSKFRINKHKLSTFITTLSKYGIDVKSDR